MSNKPYPDSKLHQMSFDEVKTALHEARRRQHSLKQFSLEEKQHFAFVDEAIAVLSYKKTNVDEAVVSVTKDKSGNVVKAKTIPDAEAPFDYEEWKKSSVKPRAMPGWGKNGGITKLVAASKAVKESEEQLDELNKSTLGSYIKKASNSAAGLATTAMHHKNTSNQWDNLRDMSTGETKKNATKRSKEFDKYSYQATQKQVKRLKGVARATDKLIKEMTDDELRAYYGSTKRESE